MTRMRAFLVSSCAAVGLAVAMPAAAQTNTKIGFVNINYLLQNAPQTQVVNQTLNAEFAPREAELVAQQEAWTTKRDNYLRDQAVMPESERTVLERELNDEARDMERTQQVLQEDLELRQTELVNELQADIARRIQGFAVAGGYDLIVTNQMVVYASEAIDITQAVLATISGNTGAESTSNPAPANDDE